MSAIADILTGIVRKRPKWVRHGFQDAEAGRWLLLCFLDLFSRVASIERRIAEEGIGRRRTLALRASNFSLTVRLSDFVDDEKAFVPMK
jgi:hypothetical protein